jgi:hypothetical protein
MKTSKSLFFGLIMGSALVLGLSAASAQQKTFIPSGHLYGPNATNLPHPNSRRSRINAQTDIYETEIYRSQVEARERSERFRLFIEHDFFAGSRNMYDY